MRVDGMVISDKICAFRNQALVEEDDFHYLGLVEDNAFCILGLVEVSEDYEIR